MSFSLIVPVAEDRDQYKTVIPHVFQLAEDGTIFCLKAITGMNLSMFDNIYFTILKSMDDRYSISEMLRLQCRIHGINNVKIVILDEKTKSQPETVYQTIRREHINGSIFIKDADNYFSCEIFNHNSIAIYPLETLKWVNPQDKSYVAIDDMHYVTNIIEKRIVSHYFSAGGYCFENSNQFVTYYEKYAHKKGRLYISHIIYAMLLDRQIFKPLMVEDYIDFNLNFKNG